MDAESRTLSWTALFTSTKEREDEAPSPGVDHSAILYNDHIYVFGGFNATSKQMDNSLWRWSFGRRQWHKMQDYKGTAPSPLLAHSAVVVGNKMYICGGTQSVMGGIDSSLTRMYCYCLDSNEWESLPSTASLTAGALSNHSCVYSADHNALYFFGGTSQAFYKYLLETHSWEAVKSTGYIPWRQDHVAVLYDGYMWVVGGQGGTRYYNDVHRFHLETRRWERVGVGGCKPEPRSRHTGALYHHFLIIHGGSDRSTFFDNVWVLDLDKLSWSQVTRATSLPAALGHREKGKDKEKETGKEEKEKQKEKEKEKEKEEDKEESYWPKGRRDHAAVLHEGWFYIIGGKERTQYSSDYLSGFDCARLPVPDAREPTAAFLIGRSGHRTGAVYTCGYGNHGQLGQGGLAQLSTPTRVVGLSRPVTKIACGGVHTTAITEDGRIYQWGGSKDSARKRLFGNPHLSPQLIASLPGPPSFYARDVACSSLHIMAVLDDAATGEAVVYEWGEDPSNSAKDPWLAQQIASLKASKVSTMAASALSTIFLTHNDEVYEWSVDTPSQLHLISLPVALTVSKIACGGGHTLLATENGTVFSFGANRYGQCGYGNTEESSEPRLVKPLQDIILLACGDNHSMVVTRQGALFTFGQGKCGQLGHGNTDDVFEPKQVEALKDLQITQVAGGGGLGCSHSIAISNTGLCYSWGSNKYGQLGHERSESEEALLLPTEIAALRGTTVLAAACGWLHSAFLVALKTERAGEPNKEMNKAATEFGYLEYMPNETLQLIFSFLGPRELGILQQVNHTFKILSEDDVLWELLLNRRWKAKLNSQSYEIIKKMREDKHMTYKVIFMYIREKGDTTPTSALTLWQNLQRQKEQDEKETSASSSSWGRGDWTGGMKNLFSALPNSKVGKMLFGGVIEKRILMVGLDAAGKTTILYRLSRGEQITTIPTIGFNCETVLYKKFKFTMWDVGGPDKIRALWRHYYQQTDAVIFVVDSNDRDRIPEAKEHIDRMMAEDELRDASLLVFANKQDLPNAASVSEVTDMLGLHALRHRKWYIQATCASTGDGLYEGMDWVAAAVCK